jgi:hypothetical protein
MKQWWPACLLVLACVHPALAQKNEGEITLSIQPGVGVAAGSFSNNYGVGVEYIAQTDYTIREGTALGVRASYRLFNTTEESDLPFVKIAQIGIHGKRFFTPQTRLGLYGVVGGGVYWMKLVGPGRSEPDFGGYGGLGLHYQSADKLAFFGEAVYNNFVSEPSSTGYFSLSVGLSIGLREE